jgi:CO dehydrogenase maturation factor
MITIAVAGKGGVGKTLVAAGIATTLARSGMRTLAIDADPAPNLALMLGLPPEEAAAIVPVSENEALVRAKTATAYPGVYNLSFTVDDIIRDFSVPTPAGVPLLVMGTVRQAGGGCSCPANAVVRNLLARLVAKNDAAVILDMEAGLEHLGRGTAGNVDVMLVVSTADSRALATAGTIARLAKAAGMPRVMAAGNRIGDAAEESLVRAAAEKWDVTVAGMIPFDRAVAENGIAGGSILGLDGSAAVRAIREMTAAILAAAGTESAAAGKERKKPRAGTGKP